MRPRKGNEKYNHKKQFIAFYDENDEFLVATFDSLKEICKHKKLEVNSKNLNLLQVHLCLALKRQDRTTWMLNGKQMHVHLINYEEN